MTHQFLDRTDVIAVFQQVGSKRMPQRMAGNFLGQTGL